MLESFVAKKRDRKAALKFLRSTMKRYGQPHEIVTDKLRSYSATMKVIGNATRQETGRWFNNRVENSQLPFQRRERAMQGFRQMRSLQKFHLFMHQFTTISTTNVISTIGNILNATDLSLWQNGGNL